MDFVPTFVSFEPSWFLCGTLTAGGLPGDTSGSFVRRFHRLEGRIECS